MKYAISGAVRVAGLFTKARVVSVASMVGVAVATLGVGAGIAAAQDYPARSVAVVAPSQAGGGFDRLARMVADGLSKHYGESFVVENRTGSGTLIGTQYVAQSTPNGYTLLMGGQSNLTFNAALYKSPGYDARSDFVNLGMVATYPYVLIARHDLPVASYQDLSKLAKEKPETLTIATAGAGTAQHILAAAFVKAIGADITLVPYKGAASAYQDILGGRVDLFIDAWPTARVQLSGGRVKPLFTTGRERLPSLPDVPTVRELGLDSVENGSWFALAAPSKIPDSVRDSLRAALVAVKSTPEWKERMEQGGMDDLNLSAEETERYLTADFKKWTTFIRQSQISSD